MLSLTTDYAQDTGDPEPYLRRIADAGFSHIHWCHQWNTDFLYSRWEVEQVAQWLADYGLRLLDLHGSAGNEKKWAAPQEYRRLAGVELVRNRIEMTARLGGEVVIMHVPSDPESVEVRRSLDELEPVAKANGVRIAIENGSFPAIARLLGEYRPDYLGLCYDSGHGNIGDTAGLDHLETLKGRLISVHLHDNDGSSDQHRLLFTGTVDWPRLARIVAQSAYAKCVSMELSMRREGIADETQFLKRAFDTGTTFAGMIAEAVDRGP